MMKLSNPHCWATFSTRGDCVVQFLLGGRAGIEADGDERTLSDRAQGVAPLVVVLEVVDLVHSAFQMRVFLGTVTAWFVMPD